MREGYGRMINHKGEVKEGKWQNGKFKGKVKDEKVSTEYFNHLGKF